MTFDYHRPGNLAEACELLSRDDAIALAGGTDLLVAIRHRTVAPAHVVDLKSVPELGDHVEPAGDMVRIGGAVTMSRLVADPLVGTHLPALAEAASVVGSVQVRNRATLAGNLCNASPAADTAPVLLAHDAAVIVSRGAEESSVPLTRFFVGPGQTLLEKGQVVTGIQVPMPKVPFGWAFARVTRRRGVDLASVSLACVVDAEGEARFGFGAVGPTPLFATAHVDELETDDDWAGLLSITRPITDVRAGADYRRAMLEIHSRRALHTALGRLDEARVSS